MPDNLRFPAETLAVSPFRGCDRETFSKVAWRPQAGFRHEAHRQGARLQGKLRALCMREMATEAPRVPGWVDLASLQAAITMARDMLCCAISSRKPLRILPSTPFPPLQ